MFYIVVICNVINQVCHLLVKKNYIKCRSQSNSLDSQAIIQRNEYIIRNEDFRHFKLSVLGLSLIICTIVNIKVILIHTEIILYTRKYSV